jgi:hypothetical protein
VSLSLEHFLPGWVSYSLSPAALCNLCLFVLSTQVFFWFVFLTRCKVLVKKQSNLVLEC